MIRVDITLVLFWRWSLNTGIVHEIPCGDESLHNLDRYCFGGGLLIQVKSMKYHVVMRVDITLVLFWRWSLNTGSPTDIMC